VAPDPVLPGYRFATPESPALVGSLPQPPVVTSYKPPTVTPSPAVPYKVAGNSDR
jgi:hypothetical protein